MNQNQTGLNYTVVTTKPPSESHSVMVQQARTHYSEQDMIQEMVTIRTQMDAMGKRLENLCSAWSAKHDKNRWILATEAAGLKNRVYNTIKRWCSDKYSGRALKHQYSEDGKLMVWVADLDRFSNGKGKFLE